MNTHTANTCKMKDGFAPTSGVVLFLSLNPPSLWYYPITESNYQEHCRPAVIPLRLCLHIPLTGHHELICSLNVMPTLFYGTTGWIMTAWGRMRYFSGSNIQWQRRIFWHCSLQCHSTKDFSSYGLKTKGLSLDPQLISSCLQMIPWGYLSRRRFLAFRNKVGVL